MRTVDVVDGIAPAYGVTGTQRITLKRFDGRVTLTDAQVHELFANQYGTPSDLSGFVDTDALRVYHPPLARTL